MRIHIEDLKFQTIIGILDFERIIPQDVIINITIDYTYHDNFINYADVVDSIKTDLVENQYFLLEDALNKLSLKLKKQFLIIDSLSLKITKPSILANCKVSVSNLYNFIS